MVVEHDWRPRVGVQHAYSSKGLRMGSGDGDGVVDVQWVCRPEQLPSSAVIYR